MPMNYTTLVGAKTLAGSIRWHANFSPLDPDEVLEQAQNWIASEMRVREMRAEATLSVLITSPTVALPTGFLDPITPIYNLTRSEKIELAEEGDLLDMRSYTSAVLRTGYPAKYAVFDELIQFDCKAETALSMSMLYYKAPALLTASPGTNFLTTRYSHILRAATNAFAAVFTKDREAYQQELTRAGGLIEKANAMDELSRRGQGGYDHDEYDEA